MQNDVLLILSLLFGTLILVMLGHRLRISYAIFLVIAGLKIRKQELQLALDETKLTNYTQNLCMLANTTR